MAKGRTWTSEEKAKIVLQGLKGRNVAELCNEYQIHQTQYYKWRDRFLTDAPKLFDTAKQSKKEERRGARSAKTQRHHRRVDGRVKKKRLVRHHRAAAGTNSTGG